MLDDKLEKMRVKMFGSNNSFDWGTQAKAFIFN